MSNEIRRHIDLFSGIGGFAIAAEIVWPAIEHTFCDNDAFSQAILKKHWPGSPIYGDIRSLTYAEVWNQQRVAVERKQDEKISPALQTDLLTGGFPCQPFSQAGRRLGTEDDRHLWPEMLRVIREFHPRWVVGENVGGFVTWSGGLVLEQVHADLEGEGYEVQSFIIPAVALNAPHRRDRVWIVAHHSNTRLQGGQQSSALGERAGTPRSATERNSNAPDANSANDQRRSSGGSSDRGRMEADIQAGQGSRRKLARRGQDSWRENWLEVATRLCTLDDGLPNGLARPRGWRNAALKGAGNAIVPQVATEIMRAIQAVDY